MITLIKSLLVATAASIVLAACGGGGDSKGGGTQSSNSVNWNPAPDWNGNTSNNSTGNSTAPINTGNIPTETDNTVTLHVDNATGGINMPYVSITVCAPGSPDQCVNVDRMLVDTGSTGVRITAGALQSLNSQLLVQAGAVDDTTGNNPIAECMPFASGYMWGSVKRADITIGSRTASNLPIQVTGDGAFGMPPDCTAYGGADMSTARVLGANGILGIGNFTADSEDATKSAVPGLYYYCQSQDSCTSTRMKANKEVANPIAAFAADYNGSVIRLPAVPASGQASVTGQLIFGVGTQANNALPSRPNIFAVDKYGLLTTQYHGAVLNRSAIDSGSPAYYFSDPSIARAPQGWYTPSKQLSLLATLEPTDGSGPPIAMPFQVDNALNLMAGSNRAFTNVGVATSSSRMFLWGLPFFYGRSVYTVIGTSKVGTHTGPFVAF